MTKKISFLLSSYINKNTGTGYWIRKTAELLEKEFNITYYSIKWVVRKMTKCNCGGMEGDHADDCPVKNIKVIPTYNNPLKYMKRGVQNIYFRGYI